MNSKELRREIKARLNEVAQREPREAVHPLINPLKPDDLVGTHSQYMKKLNTARTLEAAKRAPQNKDTSGRAEK